MSRRARTLAWAALPLLLLPATADAAGAKFRVLNAAPSGVVTIQVNGKTKISRLKLGRASRRIPMSAGQYTFTAIRPPSRKAVARLDVRLIRGQRVTIVFAMKGSKPQLQVLREAKPATGAILLTAANYASAAGAVDFRLGGVLIGKKVGFGRSTPIRRIAPDFAATGLVKVSARSSSNKVMTAADPLVLARGSVGLFAIIPRGAGVKLVRLPYDTPPPAPLKQAVIKGTPRFGNKVRCVGDSWRPKGATVTRHWTVDGAVKASAGSPLTLSTAAHAGHRIGCLVSATSKGMTTTISAAFALPGVPTPLTAPSVRVPATALVVGSSVSCNVGTWTGAPTTFAVRWVRMSTGAVIGTGRTYTLTPADNGAPNSLGCDVVATNAGGPSTPKASANTVALGIAPTVAIIARPADITESTVAVFQLAIGGGGADTVECSIDKAAFVPCTAAPAPTYQLSVPGADGANHTFDVRVANPVTAASDSDAWTVVPLTPVVTITTGPANASVTTSTSAAFTWTMSGGAATVTCEWDAVVVACASLTTANRNGLTTNANGISHSFKVTASNANPATATALGAKASRTWIVNPAPPTVSAISGPATGTTSTAASFTWSLGGGPTATVVCKLDGGTVPCATTSASVSGLSTGASGVQHTFQVTASNANTTVGQSSYSWTVNPLPPTVSAISGPTSGTTSTAASFTWSLGGGPTATVVCMLDGGTVPCATTSASVSGLSTDASGVQHTFQVTASNASATGQSSYSWIVNPPLPAVSNVQVSPGAGAPTGSFAVTFDVTGLVSGVTCQLDGEPAVSCSSGDTFPAPDPLVLSHTMVVTPSNASGTGTADSVNWTFIP